MNENSRAGLYRSLARLMDAGVPLETLFSSLADGIHSPTVRSWVSHLHARIREGDPFSVAFASAPHGAFPAHHALALGAAEQSGNVPRVLRELADEQEERLKARHELLRRSVYPLLVLHMAIVAQNASCLMTDTTEFVLACLAYMVPIDGLLVLFWWSVARSEADWIAGVLLRLPYSREFVRAREYRAFLATLRQLYEAGIPLPRAARESLVAVRNPVFRARLARALTPLEQSEPLAAAIHACPGLRTDVRGILLAAEPAGDLGAGLAQAAAIYAEHASARLGMLLRIVWGTLFTLVVLLVAYRVITFYAGYLDRLSAI